jgi:hypothetical protein
MLEMRSSRKPGQKDRKTYLKAAEATDVDMFTQDLTSSSIV